ncbi:Transcription repressor like [Actinidia chinensis var. chinensis]|uniref:Transcription repressor like n=1 Tax=Actinidia chinensis var. chinensis TaxID=1590841 RepID=A0A2R6Q0K7_ACTCC|nr:Transcription repressor like [Actinidia chinensis var. chinensis]
MRMKMMTMAGKAPSGGAVTSSGDRCSLSSPPQLTHPQHYSSLFAHRRPQFVSQKNPKTKRFTNPLTVAAKAGLPPPSLTSDDTTVSFVGEESVPLEGVIQFEKPNSFALINKWGRVALLAGGDVLALLIFSAFGRFSHGFSVFDTDTLRTADPFIAGWFLSAYFLGGFGEDGRGMNGPSKAVIAAAKSWSLGIPIGLVIRTTTVGHIPPPNFITVTMGSTALLLTGWRALLFSIFPNDDKSKKNDMYRRGSPFGLFELLTSLVRRW